MGDNLPAVSLGTGRTATALAAGEERTCALLDNGTVKCWGGNVNGQLGLGDTSTRGDSAGEMGDNLPAVALGIGRTATALAAGFDHTCAVLDNGSVKCWGYNSSGQLGLGDTANRGDAGGEMGDNLPAVSLGAGRTATALALGLVHTCALLDNGTVKCWGGNVNGELGLGDTAARGDAAGEMGDNLPAVALGIGRTATALAAGFDHTCAVLDDGSVKCWGRNNIGQLGLGDTSTRGDSAGQMGDNLPTVSLGAGRTATALALGLVHNCALLDNGSVKCWGGNFNGQLGLGDTSTRGDSAGEMGDDLPAVSLGAGRTATALAAGFNHNCTVLDNGAVKCWGYNSSGQLGLGDTAARGDAAGQMGDNLLAVSLAVVAPPGTPGSFSGTAQGTSSITWSWADVSDEAGFRVVSSTNGNMSGVLFVDVLSFTETNLLTNTAYQRRVVAFNGLGSSTSTAVTRYTLAAIPTIFSFDMVGVSSLTVSWIAGANPPGTSYRAQIWTAGGSTTTLTVIVASAAFTGLSSNTEYFMTVAAVNGDGVVSPSEVTLSTVSMGPPLPPGSFSGAALGTSSITWSWANVAREDGFRVVSSLDGNISGNLAADAVSFTETGLSANTAYNRRVVAFNGLGSSTSTAVTRYTLAAIPTSLSFDMVGVSSLTVSWIAGANPPGTSYRAQIWTAGGSTTTLTVIVASAAFTGLSSNTEYFMTVGAVNGDGVVSPSEVTLSTVSMGPPLPPGLFSGAALGTSSITWSWANVAREDGFRVVSSLDGNISGNLAADAVSFTETGLSANTAYNRRVVAFNGLGSSTSTAVTRYTLAAIPTSLSFDMVGVSSLTVSWIAGANPPGTSYRAQIWTAGGSTTTLTVIVASAAFTGLSSNTEYFMTVGAVNGNAEVSPSEVTLSTITASASASVALPPGDAGSVTFAPPSGSVAVDVPSGAFDETVTVTVGLPSILPAAPSPAGDLTATGVGVEITLDKALQPKPGRRVRIRIGYGNAGLLGDEKKLLIARYDPTRGVWVPLFSTVDETNNFVEAETDHLTTFQIMSATLAATVLGAKAFPNPLRPALGHTAMTFSNLPAGASLKVFTLTGDKVRELTANGSGVAAWDGKNATGAYAASGVYFVLAEASGGGKKTFKVAIQR